MTMRLCAIIPARGGSRRIPLKNIKDFHGKPIMVYPIEAAKQSGLFEHVIVSTDTRAIAEIAIEHGCQVHGREPDDGARGTQDVAAEVLNAADAAGDVYDAACVIYPTSPLLLPMDILRAWQLLREQHARYVMTVQAEPLADAGCLYFGWRGAFLAGLPLIDIRTVMMPLPMSRVCDINVPADFERAKRLYTAMRQAEACAITAP